MLKYDNWFGVYFLKTGATDEQINRIFALKEVFLKRLIIFCSFNNDNFKKDYILSRFLP